MANRCDIAGPERATERREVGSRPITHVRIKTRVRDDVFAAGCMSLAAIAAAVALSSGAGWRDDMDIGFWIGWLGLCFLAGVLYGYYSRNGPR